MIGYASGRVKARNQISMVQRGRTLTRSTLPRTTLIREIRLGQSAFYARR
jgi:hypothetical protein